MAYDSNHQTLDYRGSQESILSITKFNQTQDSMCTLCSQWWAGSVLGEDINHFSSLQTLLLDSGKSSSSGVRKGFCSQNGEETVLKLNEKLKHIRDANTKSTSEFAQRVPIREVRVSLFCSTRKTLSFLSWVHKQHVSFIIIMVVILFNRKMY